MCLYPKFITNPKYRPNKKNGNNPPKLQDYRIAKVPIGCGICEQCRKQRADSWKVRLLEEFSNTTIPIAYVTLTFSDESFDKLIKKMGADVTNAIATESVKLFMDNVRTYTKRKYNDGARPKYWLITELGHTGSERLHLHGFIFWKYSIEELKNLWINGWSKIVYCNAGAINYVLKYVTKVDTDHTDYLPNIYASKGFGLSIVKDSQISMCKYKGKDTRTYYITSDGHKHAMPHYIKSHIYSDEERELLWINMLDKGKRYLKGIEYDISTEEGQITFANALKQAQKESESLGFARPNNENNIKKKTYNVRKWNYRNDNK